MASNSSSRIFSGVPDITVYLVEMANPCPCAATPLPQSVISLFPTCQPCPILGWRSGWPRGVHLSPWMSLHPREASGQGYDTEEGSKAQDKEGEKVERELGGYVTGSCLGLGGKKSQRPERFSPAPTPLCHVLPASWSLLPHPGEQAIPTAQHTPVPFPISRASPSTYPIPDPEPHKGPQLFSHPVQLPSLDLLLTPIPAQPEPLLCLTSLCFQPSITLPPHTPPLPLCSPTTSWSPTQSASSQGSLNLISMLWASSHAQGCAPTSSYRL